ncbi:hypothetical protein D3C75_779710 [compost metagenome]
MQNVEQEVHHHDKHGCIRVEEIKAAREEAQHYVGPEEDLQLAESVGQGFG